MAKDKPVIAVDGRLALRNPRGGAGEYAYRLLTELGFMSRPYDLHVFGDLTADPEVLKRLRFIHPVDLLITPNFLIWEQMAWPQAIHKAALVHGLAGVAPRFTRIPRLLTLHDINLASASYYQRTIVKRLAPKASAVFVLSDSAKHDLLQVPGVVADRIVVTPPGAGPVVEPAFPKDPMFVTEERHAGTVLQALSELHDTQVQLTVMGDSDRVRAQVHALGMDGQVAVVPRPQSDEDRHHLLQRATAYIDGSPSPSMLSLQAMACGCPVIGPSVPALIIAPNDSGALAAAMRRLIASEDLQQELVAAGQEYARQKTWKRTAELTHHTYLQILQDRGLL